MKKVFLLFLSVLLLAAFPALANESPLQNMVNPWVPCTQEEAFTHIGAPFEVDVPDGYGKLECAYLSDEFATNGHVIRLAYIENSDLFRIHISIPKEGEDPFTFNAEGAVEVENQGMKGYYVPQSHTLVYYVDLYEIAIDSALLTEDNAGDYLLNVYPAHVDSDGV